MHRMIRSVLTAASLAAIACAPAAAQSGSGAKMPSCSGKSDAVVWYTAGSKTYSEKGNAGYGQGSGKYMCRSSAQKAGAKLANNQPAKAGEAMNQGSAPGNNAAGATTGGGANGTNGAMNTSGTASQAHNNGPATTGTNGGSSAGGNATNNSGAQSQAQNNGPATTGTQPSSSPPAH